MTHVQQVTQLLVHVEATIAIRKSAETLTNVPRNRHCIIEHVQPHDLKTTVKLDSLSRSQQQQQ